MNDLDETDIDAALEDARGHHQAGRLAEAETLYRRVLDAQPRAAAVLSKLAAALAGQGKLDDALEALGRALDIDPDLVEAHNNLGSVQQIRGDLEDAARSYGRALAIDPGHASAHVNLGHVLKRQGKLEDAIVSYRRALVIDPGFAEAHNGLGVSLLVQGKPEEAAVSFENALKINPQHAEAHNNLGNVLRNQGRLDEAVASIQRALALAPDLVEAHINLGNARKSQRRVDDAAEAYTRALSLDPANPEAHWNFAQVLLLMGRLGEGWAEYAWRTKCEEFRAVNWNFKQPLWNGSDLNGRTVLFYAEQGFGDTIQFLRYLPMVAAQGTDKGTDKGGEVILQCPPQLTRLFEASPAADGIQLVTEIGDTPFDLQAPLHGLPGIFATTLDTIPADVPYLRPPGDTPPALETSGGFKVGLVWAGNPKHKNDANRSIDFERFTPLLDMESVDFYSLQVGERGGDIRNNQALGGLEGKIVDLGQDLGDFAATAAAIGQLDLVITVDTSVAHLTGALGAPVWTLLPWVPDWRWLLNRDDSPWYPTMRLFRQQTAGDWDAVIGEVVAALGDQAAGGSRQPQTGTGRKFVAEIPFKYNFLRYNQYGVLKAHWPLKFCLLFLCRHMLLLIALVAMGFRGGGGPEMTYLTPLLDKAFIISDLPALAVFYLIGARRPESKDLYRWIWRNGRALILASVAMYLGIVTLRNGLVLSNYAAVEWVMIAGNAVVAFYAWRSQFIRDLFNEFPPPPGEEEEAEPES